MLQPDLTLNAIPPHPVCSGTCHPTEFRCRDGCCIDSFLECDDTPDCPDASDEATCEKCETWEREGWWAEGDLTVHPASWETLVGPGPLTFHLCRHQWL